MNKPKDTAQFLCDHTGLAQRLSLIDPGDYPRPISDIASNSANIKNQISQIKKSEGAIGPTADVLAKHGSRLRHNRRKKSVNNPSNQLKLPF